MGTVLRQFLPYYGFRIRNPEQLRESERGSDRSAKSALGKHSPASKAALVAPTEALRSE